MITTSAAAGTEAGGVKGRSHIWLTRLSAGDSGMIIS